MSRPEPKYRNSAGRLLVMLQHLQTGQAIMEILPRYCGFETGSPQDQQRATLESLRILNALYSEFLSDLREAAVAEQQRNVILTGLVKLQEMLYPLALNGAFRVATEAELALLEVAATVIPEEDQPAENDLRAIRDSIESLRELVEDAEISTELRKLLLELIRLSEDAVARYNIHGARGLRRAFKLMIAEVLETYSTTSGGVAPKQPTQENAWSRIKRHLQTVDTVASRLLKYKALLGKAAQRLLGDGDGT